MHQHINHTPKWNGYTSTLVPIGPTNDHPLRSILLQQAKCLKLTRLRPFKWWFIALALVFLNIIILSPIPLRLKTLAVLILTNLLPGALLVHWLVGARQASPPWWEQGLYSLGGRV